MLLKTLTSILIYPIVLLGQLFGSSNTQVYVATSTPIETKQEQQIVHKERSTTTSEQAPKKEVSTKKTAKTKIITNTATSTNSINNSIEEPIPDFTVINSNARKSIINIFCITKNNDLSPISGTGVIINSNGLILTNAHIGQYFLLKDYREKDYLKCIGRDGSPAYPKYNLELVYISEDWVKENKSLLKEQIPKGTGENDFAFLRITSNIDNSKLEQKISYTEPNIRELIGIGEPVLLASYPAGFLGGLSIIRDLNITSAVTNIQDVFTFKDGTIDIVSVGGTVVSQKGSSGGLVVDKNTSLIGIITTSSDGNTTSARGLNAITLSYINRSLQRELSLNMREFLELDHQIFASKFKDGLSKELSKLIIDELNRQ